MTLRINGALLTLVGAPGSGKSTWAQKWFTPTQILSSDRMRGMLTDDESYQDCNPHVFYLIRRIAEVRMSYRRTTVVDATNATEKACDDLIGAAKPVLYGMHTVGVVFHTPLDVCLARNAARPRPVPAKVVCRIHAQITERVWASLERAPGYVSPFTTTVHVGPGWHAVRGYVPKELREAPWIPR